MVSRQLCRRSRRHELPAQLPVNTDKELIYQSTDRGLVLLHEHASTTHTACTSPTLLLDLRTQTLRLYILGFHRRLRRPRCCHPPFHKPHRIQSDTVRPSIRAPTKTVRGTYGQHRLCIHCLNWTPLQHPSHDNGRERHVFKVCAT